MTILEDEVSVKLSSNNTDYYEKLGYEIHGNRKNFSVKRGTFITVKVDDLSKGNIIKLTKICDKCGINLPEVSYCDIIKNRKNGKDHCKKCSQKVRRELESTKLPAYEKRLSTTHPKIAKMMQNQEVADKLTYGSNKKERFICRLCGDISEKKSIANVVRRGFRCSKCSDGISYPEKFMISVLNQLELDFQYRKTFNWASDKEYDFYIPSLKCIIETHGEHHYKYGFASFGEKTLEDEKENDRLKRNYANFNGIEHYIEINCSDSSLLFIRDNILDSKLVDIINVSNVDWNKCLEFVYDSLIKVTSDLWNEKYGSVEKISNKLNLSMYTIYRYLKIGTKLGWCSYDPEKNKGFIKDKIPVVQLSLRNEYISEWDSLIKVNKQLGINDRAVSNACKGKQNTSGGYRWMFKDDYEKCKDILDHGFKQLSNSKTVVQLTLDYEFIKEWSRINDVAKHFNTHRVNISTVCRGIYNQSNGYKWMYKEDYENNKDSLKYRVDTNKREKRIVQLAKDGEFIQEWKRIKDAKNHVGLKSQSGITDSCKNTGKTAGGFKWMYLKDYENKKNQE